MTSSIKWLEGSPAQKKPRVRWLGETSGMLGVYGPACASGDWTKQSIPGVKPYEYLVQSGDGMYSIAFKFGRTATTSLGPLGWGQLRDANPQLQVVHGAASRNATLYPVAANDPYNTCILLIGPNDRLKIPSNWADPTDWSSIVCPDASMDWDHTLRTCVPKPGNCTTGADCTFPQVCVNGKCVTPTTTLCPDGFPQYPDGSCVRKCPDGQNKYNNGTCPDPCKSGLALVNGECVCPDGKHADYDGTCPPQCSTTNPCATGQCIAGKCYTPCPSAAMRRDPVTGLCVQCPKGQFFDPKDITKCLAPKTASSGGDSGLLILGLAALAAIGLAIAGAGDKNKPKPGAAPAMRPNPRHWSQRSA